MTWHVVTRVGLEDDFMPELPASEPRLVAPFERAGDPWAIGNNVLDCLRETVGALPSSTATDLLYLAMSVYTADLRIPRRLAADRWGRDICLYIPVRDLALWSGAMPLLVRTLNYLSGDHWQIHFRERSHSDVAVQKVANDVDALCLFSGGLDSLAGAIDLLAQGRRPALIGHHGAGMANAVQARVLEHIKKAYPGQALPLMFYVQPPKRKLKDGEPSMRSRSFLFLSLGVAAGSAFGKPLPLVVAENGLISLNVPLTPARAGSLSTRTTHPHFMALYRKLLAKLSIDVSIELPYRFKTKGQMLAECGDQTLLKATAPLTMSCSHSESGRYQGFTPGNHCGYCVPCIIRRASMAHASLPDAHYNVDVLKKKPDHRGDSGRDFRAFQMAIERYEGTSALQALQSVLSTGPLPPEDAAKYAATYQVGMDEVIAILKRRKGA